MSGYMQLTQEQRYTLSVMLRKNCSQSDIARAIADALDARFHFAHPCASWEHGSNENGNGLIRQYPPKGTDFATVTDRDPAFFMRRLNNRPRKWLGMKTPNQVFFDKRHVALGS